MSLTHYDAFTAWVKFGSAVRTINMGKLPGPCFVFKPLIGIPTAFNSGTDDTLTVGDGTDVDAFGTSYDLNAATDLAEFTGGVDIGYNLTGKDVVLTYTPSGSAASLGLAIVIFPFLRLPFPP